MKEIKADHIYLIGDVHGNYSIFSELSRTMQPNSIYIQVGDFGMGFNNSLSQYAMLNVFKEKLLETNSECFVIRGNHDKPSFFDGKKEEQISYLKDYTYIKINKEIWLFVGGSISIDRHMRREGVNWWKDEETIYNPDLITSKCDVLITHGSPASCEPRNTDDELRKIITYYVPKVGNHCEEMFDDLRTERQILERVLVKSGPKFHYYGHFHYSHEEQNGAIYSTLLNINEVKKHL